MGFLAGAHNPILVENIDEAIGQACDVVGTVA
jgi:hypothetical protein